VGTPVYASRSGVALTGNIPQGYGRYVMIIHPDGLQSMYGHLSDWNVVSGQKVRRGDLIGYVGKTGNAARKAIEPHLHFEIRRRGEPIDPKGLLK
jgi:murein DD-endopeptidase MepM/ murein hydrolase activator NlpD